MSVRREAVTVLVPDAADLAVMARLIRQAAIGEIDPLLWEGDDS